MKVQARVKQYLDSHNVSAYRLAQETAGTLAPTTVYALARPTVKRVDLETLGEVMTALERITGQPVTLTDLLEVVADPIPLSIQQDPLELTGAAQLQATLEALETDTQPAELQGWLERFEQPKQSEQAGA